jgi:hypothetical protein
MSRAVAELRQIPFEQLIGAPMKAAVEAQALAAQSTVEFIQKVGFKAANFEPDDMLFEDPANDADAGTLRNVTFKYLKKNENDTEAEFELTVPLLAIVPIPYLRIDEMTIDFSAKLTDSVQRNTSSTFNLSSTVTGKFSSFWSPVKTSFRTTATYNTKSATRAAQKREYRMDIHVRAVQDEMPSGLSKVLDILEDAIKDEPSGTS